MANHELPEWEAPSSTTTPRNSFWQRLSQPFTPHNPFLSSRRPTLDHKNTFLARKSPLTRTQDFDKETGVPETVRQNTTDDGEISPQGNQRRYCGRSRRSLLLMIVASVILLALIIGLSVGLSRKSYVNLNTFIGNNPI